MLLLRRHTSPSACSTVFSAGLDISELYNPDIKRLKSFTNTFFELVENFFNTNVVTAAAINGHTSAGACVLSMLCGYRVMVGGRATIGFNDTAVGVVPAQWIIDLFKYYMGARLAEYAILTSVLVVADEALKLGFIDEKATDKADAINKCKKYIKLHNNISRDIWISTKRTLRKDYINDYRTHRKQYEDIFFKSIVAPDAQRILEHHLRSLKQKKMLKK